MNGDVGQLDKITQNRGVDTKGILKVLGLHKMTMLI